MLNNQLTEIAALVGTFLPLLIAVIQRQHWSSKVRVAVGIAACAIAAVIVSYTKGQLNLHDLATTGFIIFTLTKTTYLSVWKPTGIAGKVEESTGGGTSNPDYVLPAP
jgi:hypothetical protein